MSDMDRYMLKSIAISAALAAALFSGAASAQDLAGPQAGDFVVKVGAADILFGSSARISVAGTEVPDASAKLSNSVTPTMEVEYFLTPSISAAVDFGLPPETRVTATGSLAALGTVGKVRYGLGGLTARYHINALGRFSPFVGGGVGHLFIFKTTDGSVSNLEASNAWAPVIQGGFDYRIDRHVGLFANVSYVPLKNDASGTAFGAPMTARVTLNPTIVQGGLSYRF